MAFFDSILAKKVLKMMKIPYICYFTYLYIKKKKNFLNKVKSKKYGIFGQKRLAMDFFKIVKTVKKNGQIIEIVPDFKIGKIRDLMIKGQRFYAVWNEDKGLWSTDETDVQEIIDKALNKYISENELSQGGYSHYDVKYVNGFNSSVWTRFQNYVKSMPDNFVQLDCKITFASTPVTQKDFVSKRLPYDPVDEEPEAWNRLISVLYDEENRRKIEWLIGAIATGDSKTIQKFFVFFGDPGTGKSTILDIVQMLFRGYCSTFSAKDLASSNKDFSTEVFKDNPLVAIQDDGDLSRIDDNTKLNSIVSHKSIVINEKHKSQYAMTLNSLLLMATNQPVKISDAKAGIIRRLVDIRPTGNKLSVDEYYEIMSQIEYELGAIVNQCIAVYRKCGKSYYNSYKPVDMMYKTDFFFNFVENSYLEFDNCKYTKLSKAYLMYKEYCKDYGADKVLPMFRFREELKNYFDEFIYEGRIDGVHIRSIYRGFKKDKFKFTEMPEEIEETEPCWIDLKDQESLIDNLLKDCPAQYATSKETPKSKWADTTTTLKELDTRKLHYVKVPENHIVIDFDIRDENGNKSLEKNLAAASSWPKTYAETSKSGEGLHLHYIYSGDVNQLSRIATDEVEIKVFTGGASLRRKLVKCNDIPVYTISSGLPLREVKKMVGENVIQNQEHLRGMIIKALKREVGSGHTKPSIDFIAKILDDAYNSGMEYDVMNLRQSVLNFAMGSTNQSEYCLKVFSTMKFASENDIHGEAEPENDDRPIALFDCEVYPNLFLLCYKKYGKNYKVHKMFNPKAEDVAAVFKAFRMIGFNNRRYDNHICYAAANGYSNEQIYQQSQSIINGTKDGFFGEAYNYAYADIYEISSKKQSLKKFEVELGIFHKEMEEDWNQPLPKEKWEEAGDYCANDVLATEAVFDDRAEDFVAREILAKLSGLSVSDTTRMHATRIIFGDDRHPQLVYTDLSKEFPGYKFENGHSSYMGEDPGEGGRVFANPGMYGNVGLLDIVSMHPSTAVALNYFGKYTKRFEDLKLSRRAIKYKDFDALSKLLDGQLMPFVEGADDKQLKKLSYALKIVINMVYGFTTANFDNPFKDPRNVDNIIAKRGALFMMNLQKEVENRGYTVVHIKTDSIKIADVDDNIIAFVNEYGKKYGYEFDHEATYEKLCLVNDAVYIAKDASDGHWTATGTQFQVPYVFKKCFSKEEIVFDDLCETKQVSTALYLDFDPDGDHDYHFIGKVGKFCPMKKHGGVLLRKSDDKFNAATASKGYLWAESDVVKANGWEEDIDLSYYDALAEEAIDTINKYGDYYWFISDEPYVDEVPFSGSKIVKN